MTEDELLAIEATARETPGNAAAMRVLDLTAAVRDMGAGYLRAEAAYRGICQTMAQSPPIRLSRAELDILNSALAYVLADPYEEWSDAQVHRLERVQGKVIAALRRLD